MASSRVLSILLLPALLRSTLASTCFYPSGATNTSLVACDPTTATATTCCASGWQCLSNGFCADPQQKDFEILARSGCTDKSWGNDCPKYCKSNITDGEEAVYYCGAGKYCCDDSDCCTNNDGVISLGAPAVVATAGSDTASSSATSQSIATSTTIMASSTAQNQLTLDTAPSPTPFSSAPASFITITMSNGDLLTMPIATRTHNPAQASADLTKSIDTSRAIGIGVGVGASCTVIAIIFGTWICIRRRKRYEQQAGVTSRSIESNPFESRQYVVELVREPPSVGERSPGSGSGQGRRIAEALEKAIQGQVGHAGKGKEKEKDKVAEVVEESKPDVIRTAPF